MHGCVGEAWPRVLPPWVTKDVKGIPKNQWCLSYQMWNHHGQRILEVCRPVLQWSNLSIFWLCCSRHVQLCLHDISWLGQIEWDKIWDQTSPCEWMHEYSLIRRLMPTSGYPITCTWHLLVVRRMNPHMAFIFHAFQWAAEMGLQAEVHVLPHCQVWRRGPTLDSGCSIQRGWHSLEEGTSSCVSYVSWMHLDALVEPCDDSVKIT